MERGLKKLEIRGQIETIKTTALLILAKNTEKSPRDLGKLAISQIQRKNIS